MTAKIYDLADFTRGQMQFALGRNGLVDRLVLRGVLVYQPTGRVKVLPRRRRRRMGAAKVLDFPMRAA